MLRGSHLGTASGIELMSLGASPAPAEGAGTGCMTGGGSEGGGSRCLTTEHADSNVASERATQSLSLKACPQRTLRSAASLGQLVTLQIPPAVRPVILL